MIARRRTLASMTDRDWNEAAQEYAYQTEVEADEYMAAHTEADDRVWHEPDDEEEDRR